MLARLPERNRLDELLASIRDGRSSTLVLSGGAGVGKTTLLDYLEQHSAGIEVLRITGIQSEMELTYAALHQLCRPVMGAVEALAEPLKDALGTTFGARAGAMPDKFLLGLAVLSLLSEVSRDRPVICLIDDVQWLDGASTEVLGFVARRLAAEGVGMVFSLRRAESSAGLDGIPVLEINGLDLQDAHSLLTSLAPGAVDPGALDRIIDEADGNPLILVESVLTLSREELAAGIMLPGATTRLTSIQERFHRRVMRLPLESQQLLVIAAAETMGNARIVQLAATAAGIHPDAVQPAITEGLCVPGAGAQFRHPLVRSTIYRTASADSRRAAHAAIAAVGAQDMRPELHAWHRAQAAEGTDEQIAVELADAARLAISRGAPAIAAVLLKQARQLSGDEQSRAAWSLLLAQVELSSGHFDEAARDLQSAPAGTLGPTMRAESSLIAARLAFARERGAAAIALFLEAADLMVDIDPEGAQAAFLEALSAALFAGRLAASDGLWEVATRWRAAGSPLGREPVDLLRDAFLSVISEGDEDAWEEMRAAFAALQSEGDQTFAAVPWLRVAFSATSAAWDLEAWDYVSHQLVDISRARGDYSELPMALSSLAFVQIFSGELVAASETVDEMTMITAATRARVSPYGAIGVAALQGREAALMDLIEASVPDAKTRADATGVAVGHWAAALLNNGLGRYDLAFANALEAVPLHHSLHATTAWAFVELIEAGSRLDGAVDLQAAWEQLESAIKSGGTDWALGVLARSRALLSADAEAEQHFIEALRLLEHSRARFDFARACLVYGEWLRRHKRISHAREQLSRAERLFEEMGATAFARRAANELRATGSQIRRSSSAVRGVLTVQEAQVARLVSQGLSNSEVGARMFISPRTVEYHLSKVFDKLGISSRHQIGSFGADELGATMLPSG